MRISSPSLSRPSVKALSLLVPWIYLGVAALFSEGVRRQPHIVLAGSPGRFAVEVAAAGGVESVRVGLVLDLVFVLTFVAVTATILSRASGRWWLPVIPAALDLAENVLIAVCLDHVNEHMARLLYVLAISKFAAYLVVVGMVIIHLFRRRSQD
jgi:hypothetical protein